MEFGNGTIGDMGIHMLDMVRWFMGLGWPKRISSFGGLRILTGGKSDIADTQTAMFEFDNLTVVWQHRRFGPSVDANYPWGATLYGEKGTLKAGVMGYDFIPADRGGPGDSQRRHLRARSIPRGSHRGRGWSGMWPRPSAAT